MGDAASQLRGIAANLEAEGMEFRANALRNAADEIEQLKSRECEVFRAGWEAGYGGTDIGGINEGACEDDYQEFLTTKGKHSKAECRDSKCPVHTTSKNRAVTEKGNG